ncbi:hypothetical protein GCM10028815_05410 [Mariniluteicoccus flavus]
MRKDVAVTVSGRHDVARTDQPGSAVVWPWTGEARELPGDREIAAALGLSVLDGVEGRPGLRESLAAGVDVGVRGAATTTLVAPDGRVHRLVVVHVGDDPTPQALGEAATLAARHVEGATTLVSALPRLAAPGDLELATELVAEGLVLGSYRYGRAEEPRVELLGAGSAEAARAGVRTGALANHARRLVERPADDLDPDAFAAACVELLEGAGVACEVWDAAELERCGFGATVAVGRGSRSGARLVVGRRSGRTRHLGLAGKGITFDSGGVNIKTDTGEIAWMKSDMAGAASVAGAVAAAVAAGADPTLTVALPIAENMVSRDALRPGDVVTHPNRRTTEVTNTDCEGRLVLADALTFLAGEGADGLVDVGTLTDGGGFGPKLWSVSGRGLIDELMAAGRRGVGTAAGRAVRRPARHAGRRRRELGAGFGRGWSPDGGGLSVGVHRRASVGAHRQRGHRIPHARLLSVAGRGHGVTSAGALPVPPRPGVSGGPRLRGV